MRSSHSAERWGRSDSGVPESPVFGAKRQKRAKDMKKKILCVYPVPATRILAYFFKTL
jgi:hypothetical protein